MNAPGIDVEHCRENTARPEQYFEVEMGQKCIYPSLLSI
jgi:hypothetical protein